MPLPSSGQISVSDINTELGRAPNTANSSFAGSTTPQSSSLFKLGEVGGINQTAPHAMSEWYNVFPSSLKFTHDLYNEAHGYNDPDSFNIDTTDSSWANTQKPTYGVILHPLNSPSNSLNVNSGGVLGNNKLVYLGSYYEGSTNKWRIELVLAGTNSAITTWNSLDITFTPTFTAEVVHTGFKSPSSTYTEWEISEANDFSWHYDETPVGIAQGMSVTGSGIPSNTTISSATSKILVVSRTYYRISLSNACYIYPNTLLTFNGSSTTTTLNRADASVWGASGLKDQNGTTQSFLVYTWLVQSSNPFGIGDGTTLPGNTTGQLNFR